MLASFAKPLQKFNFVTRACSKEDGKGISVTRELDIFSLEFET